MSVLTAVTRTSFIYQVHFRCKNIPEQYFVFLQCKASLFCIRNKSKLLVPPSVLAFIGRCSGSLTRRHSTYNRCMPLSSSI